MLYFIRKNASNEFVKDDLFPLGIQYEVGYRNNISFFARLRFYSHF